MSASQNVTYQTLVGQISAMNEFTFPAQYLSNQRYSYNQHLSFDLGTGLRRICHFFEVQVDIRFIKERGKIYFNWLFPFLISLNFFERKRDSIILDCWRTIKFDVKCSIISFLISKGSLISRYPSFVSILWESSSKLSKWDFSKWTWKHNLETRSFQVQG